MKNSSRIVIGKIVGTFGLKGFLKVQVFTDFVERFNVNQVITIGEKEFRILNTFWHKSQLRVFVEGIDSIDLAEEMIGLSVTVSSEDRPHLEEEEYYVQDLIGFKVFDQNGNELGVIEQIHPNPAHALIQVGELYVPAIKQFVKKINMEKRFIRVKLLEGM